MYAPVRSQAGRSPLSFPSRLADHPVLNAKVGAGRVCDGRSRDRSVTELNTRYKCMPLGCLSVDVANGSTDPYVEPGLVNEALEALRKGQPVAILDAKDREGETDLFFCADGMKPVDMRLLRRAAGGEMYVAIGSEVASHFGLPYVGGALNQLKDVNPLLGHMQKENSEMCQGSCSVGLSFDHRSTHTGAPDNERSFTCGRFAELYRETTGLSREEAAVLLGEEFHIPGHIFFCIENKGGVAVRSGHTDLSVALARMAGVAPIMVGCVMLENEGSSFGALGPDEARLWAAENNVPFLDGQQIINAALGQGINSH